MELKGAVSDISRAIEIGIKDSLIRSEAYAMRGSFYINPQNLNGVKITYVSNNELTASYDKEKHKIDEIINKVKDAGMEISDISTDEGNLEDVFVDLTKE